MGRLGHEVAGPRPRVLERLHQPRGDGGGRKLEAVAARLGRDRKSFKTDVRKLKELGLTESLEVGYRLSPRGRAWLQAGK